MSGEDGELKFLRNGLEELVQYDKNCCLFLERMRLYSSYDLVQKFKSFIKDFVGVQHDSAETCSEAVHAFVEDVFVSISEHPLWRDEGTAAWDQATEAAERYLMTKLYKVTYVLPCTSDITDDETFHHRARSLQFLKTSHFDIPERPLNRVAMEMAARELHKADNENMKSPMEKLTCILNCIAMLSNLLKYYGSESGTGADDLLPYLIYTILILSPKHMQSNIRFVLRFRRESKLKSEAAYYFTQIESAVLFILDVNHTNLSISELEFKQGLEHCEELISSGLDINHFDPTSSATPIIARRPVIVDTPSVAAPSPILARKASVIKEWSNLQRSRALSLSEDDQNRVNGSENSTAGVFEPARAASPTGMGARISLRRTQSLQKAADEGGVAETDLPGGARTDIQQKLASAKFEDLTISDLKQVLHGYQALLAAQSSSPAAN